MRLLLACAAIAIIAALTAGAAPQRAWADEKAPHKVVTENHLRLGALDLTGRHVRPAGASLMTVLIVHDTLGAFGDPTIAALQEALAARGYASLAINLSLGESGRTDPLACNARHVHKHEDALKEIGLWTDWLQGQGLGPVVLAGHGRGGAQAAWALAREGWRYGAAALLAPTGWTPRQADAEFRARYSDGIAALLTRVARLAPDDLIENVPFLHCGAVSAAKASIVSYYGPEPMRDTPTALAEVRTPTLVLTPERATGLAEDDVDARLLAMKNPAVSVRVIEGAEAQFEEGAMDRAADAIDAYLRSVFPK